MIELGLKCPLVSTGIGDLLCFTFTIFKVFSCFPAFSPNLPNFCLFKFLNRDNYDYYRKSGNFRCRKFSSVDPASDENILTTKIS